MAGADLDGTRLSERYPHGFVPQGISAELIAARWGIGRSALDAFSLTSQQRAAAARDAGHFDHEIVPLKVAGARSHRLGPSAGRVRGSIDRDAIGLQVICEAGGLANAMVIERLPQAA